VELAVVFYFATCWLLFDWPFIHQIENPNFHLKRNQPCQLPTNKLPPEKLPTASCKLKASFLAFMLRTKYNLHP